MVRRYDLGGHILIKNFVDEFNEKFSDFQLYTISGIVMDANLQFTAVVEYFEYNATDVFLIDNHKKELSASILLSKKLNIPLFIITFSEGDNYFKILDYFKNSNFKKSIIYPSKEECEFLTWWKKYKGTAQSKPFYRDDYTKWKINRVFNTGTTKWGGDLDGIIIINDSELGPIIEFRKATQQAIENYDPRDFFNGIGNRKGDYMTWWPLISLKNQIQKKLFLVTLSELSNNKFGITEISGITNNDLLYKNKISPKHNIKSDINEIFDILIS